jgi:hypothetical protein
MFKKEKASSHCIYCTQNAVFSTVTRRFFPKRTHSKAISADERRQKS